MKLIFPQGEHAPYDLVEGVVRIGSAVDCDLRIEGTGVAAHHCEIETREGSATVRAVDPAAATVFNGRQITEPTELAPGDLLLFGRVGCRIGTAAPQPPPASEADAQEEMNGHTVLRMAMPKYLLRGVSGATFGKTFALTGSMIMGRQPDCDIAIASDEVSRRHARLTVRADGVAVDDLGSANGTFVNDKRVQSAVLRSGDELRLDTVRFQLTTPGSAVSAAKPAVAGAPVEAPRPDRGRFALWIAIGGVAAAIVAVGVLHYLGVL
jgi:pSer/pThr/pTyr-binding forkhead associated (FHA) protein